MNGVGNVDIEQRVDELRQQKRKCQISKCKAEARLKALKEGGLSVECLELIEQNLSEEVENQMRQQQQQRQQEKQRLEVTGSDPNDVILSRTPSLRSTNISPDFGRISAMENKSTYDQIQLLVCPEQNFTFLFTLDRQVGRWRRHERHTRAA